MPKEAIINYTTWEKKTRKLLQKDASVHRFTNSNDLLGFFTKQLTCCVPCIIRFLHKELALPHNGQTKITSTEEHGTADMSMQPRQFWYWCWCWWIDTPWRRICKLFEFHELAHLSCCEVGITDRCHWKSKKQHSAILMYSKMEGRIVKQCVIFFNFSIKKTSNRA